MQVKSLIVAQSCFVQYICSILFITQLYNFAVARPPIVHMYLSTCNNTSFERNLKIKALKNKSKLHATSNLFG
jgi:hypothetical protein